jgi:hypothetical protein
MIELFEKEPELFKRVKRVEVSPINVKPENFTKIDFIMHIAGGPNNVSGKVNLLKRFLTT